MLKSTFAAMLAVFGFANGACAESWRTYHNTRFGTTAQVPSTWTEARAPANNDGRQFNAPDKTGSIVISGIFSMSKGDDELNDRAKPNEGEVITYQQRGPRSIVVSGTVGNKIFYRKSILGCEGQIWNDLSIEYPAAAKADYDAIVSHVSASLRGGRGYEIETCK